MSTGLRIFAQREFASALTHSSDGFQALHLMSGSFAYLRSDTPNCFKGRRQIAHLFDRDRERLIRTAKSFGVRVIKVEYPGHGRQHIDLCGKPLERAIELASQEQWENRK